MYNTYKCIHVSADPLGSHGRVGVLRSAFGEPPVLETLGPRGSTPRPTQGHLRRLVTPAQILMKITALALNPC